jgi:hypothetical protein
LYSNNDTGISLNDGAMARLDGPVIQTNTVGLSINSAADQNYGTNALAYFEANGTDVVIAGTSATHRVYSPKISGYINHSNAAGPCVTMTYTDNPVLDGLYVSNILNNTDFLSVGAYVRSLAIRSTSQEGIPYISSTGMVATNTIMDRKNLVLNGAFDTWTAGDTLAPDSWTLYTSTIAKTASDERDGSYVAEITSTGAGGVLYQDITIPPALRLAGLPFIVVADIKKVSGATGANVVVAPLDGAGTAQGVSSTVVQTTSTSWGTHTANAGYITSSATKLRVSLYPGGTDGVARFARVAVYYGSTPWIFERNLSEY